MKQFLLPGSYKTQLPIKEMNNQARRYWRTVDSVKKQEALDKKKLLLKCWIITERDLH